jgi:hypothetical protein
MYSVLNCQCSETHRVLPGVVTVQCDARRVGLCELERASPKAVPLLRQKHVGDRVT